MRHRYAKQGASHSTLRIHQAQDPCRTDEKDAYPRHCDTCDYDAKTKHAWEQHCDGKKHKAKTIQTITIPTIQDVEKKRIEVESILHLSQRTFLNPVS